MVGLAWVNGHTDMAIPAVALSTGTEVFVGTSVDTGSMGMTDVL